MKLPERFLELSLCVVGIMGFFILYGFLQEKLMTDPYDPNNPEESKFKDSAFLVLCNRLVAIFVALFMLWKNGESLKHTAPLQNYFYVSFSNFSATFCQYEALKYVSFPTQTLGKCGKMVPVLVIGSLFHQKAYTWKDYIVAFFIMIGCTIFLTTGDISSGGGKSDTPIGLALLVAYLFFDGFTSTTQEKMFKGYSMSTYNQMLYVNSFSALLSILVLFVNQKIGSSIQFALTYPAMLRDAVFLSLCASLGQMVIYYTIKNFGALIYSTIMTTRQFASLLLSSIIFFHPLTLSQWSGVVMVFGALYYEGFMKEKKKDGAHGHSHSHGPHGHSHSHGPEATSDQKV